MIVIITREMSTKKLMKSCSKQAIPTQLVIATSCTTISLLQMYKLLTSGREHSFTLFIHQYKVTFTQSFSIFVNFRPLPAEKIEVENWAIKRAHRQVPDFLFLNFGIL